MVVDVGGRVGTHPELAGHRVAEVAEERGCTPLDVMLDVSLDDDLEARFWSVLANDDPEGIAWLLPRDNVLLGLADSGARVAAVRRSLRHPICSASGFATAAPCRSSGPSHKLRGEPAAVYGLSRSGTVAVGKAADLCVSSTPTPSAQARCAGCTTFPAHGEQA